MNNLLDYVDLSDLPKIKDLEYTSKNIWGNEIIRTQDNEIRDRYELETWIIELNKNINDLDLYKLQALLEDKILQFEFNKLNGNFKNINRNPKQFVLYQLEDWKFTNDKKALIKYAKILPRIMEE